MDSTQLEHVQSFRAATMRDALNAVRQSLGEDAIIVETRRVSEEAPRKGWRRGEAIDLVEVTAGVETAVDTNIDANDEWVDGSLRPSSSPVPPGTHAHGSKESERFERERLRDHRDETDSVDELPAPPPLLQTGSGEPRFQPTTQRTGEEQTERWQAGNHRVVDQASEARNVASRPERHPVDYDVDETPLTERLAAIEDALRSLTRDRRGHGPIVDRLANRGIPVSLARHIVQEAASHDPTTPPSVDDLVHATAQHIRAEPTPAIRPGEQRRIALIGPTGVGKTTTVAKLAAGYRIQQNLTVGLITVDDYRVAAADQLRTYADLIQCPVRVVSTDNEMQHAVADLNECDVILIDTAGLGRPDDEQLNALDRRLAIAGVQDRYFVISVCNTLASTRIAAERYRSLRPTAAIYTKLDETPEPGILVGIASDVPLPVRYVTIGQEVPRDLEIADSQRLAEEIIRA